MKLVAGSTGNAGAAVVAALHSMGEPVRALARTRQDLGRGIEVVEADLGGRAHRRVSDADGAGGAGKRDHGGVETARVDSWLWAVRVFKTRSVATAACRGGHVRINGSSVKPATPVRVGDRVQAHVHHRRRELEVVRLVDKRVGPAVAAECLIDHTPPIPGDETQIVLARDAGAGRPTKRERRQLDQFRAR